MTLNNNTLLELRGIVKSYGQIDVLREIDLAIADGEFICFLGPSGCGKSTLLRIIAGLESQTHGSIHKAGQDISRLPAAQRDVGILFQSYALFPNLSVAENVAYGLVNRRVARSEIAARVAELLALVGLPDSGKKWPSQLSGGQQQRVALARALAPSPGVLLLDEPLSALDAKVRIHLRQQIKHLQEQLKLTTIMVTHDQDEALTMADRIVVMNHGVIEQVGTPWEIYQKPASRFVADFVGKMNFLTAHVEADGHARVGQKIFSLADAACTTAGPATLGFRPEQVSARELPDQPNSIEGQVIDLEFLGANWRAAIQCPDLPGDTPIRVDFSAEEARTIGLQKGLRLHLTVAPEHVHVFSERGPRR